MCSSLAERSRVAHSAFGQLPPQFLSVTAQAAHADLATRLQKDAADLVDLIASRDVLAIRLQEETLVEHPSYTFSTVSYTHLTLPTKRIV